MRCQTLKLVMPLIVTLSLLMAMSAQSDEIKDGVKYVDAVQAQRLIDEGAGLQVLDVRTPREFAEGHIDGAINVDFRASNFEQQIRLLDPEATYLVHCRSGGRSGKSLAKLKSAGIKNLIHLDGGILAWNKEGLPLSAE